MSDKPSKKELQERWASDEFVSAKQSALDEAFKTKVCREAADLRGIAVGVDGPIDWLAWADLRAARLQNIDFGFGRFSCCFTGGEFRAVRFTGCRFEACLFAEAQFAEADLSQSVLVAPWLEDAVFIDCRFHGTRIRGRGWLFPNSSGRRIKFERCDFRDCTFEPIDMAGVDFIDCRFEAACFKECRVFNWRFRRDAPTQNQFLNCQYRGKNTGLEVPEGPPRGLI